MDAYKIAKLKFVISVSNILTDLTGMRSIKKQSAVSIESSSTIIGVVKREI